MKKLFSVCLLSLAITGQARELCPKGEFSVWGNFSKWEHPDYGWICSINSKEVISLTNCASIGFTSCEQGQFRIASIQLNEKPYCIYEAVQARCLDN